MRTKLLHSSALTRPASAPNRPAGLAWAPLVVVMAAALGGGWYYLRARADAAAERTPHDALLHTVERDDFELVITERGEIESVGGVLIKSEVRAKNSPGVAILDIVPEGATVAEGDFLVQLDSSALEEELLIQQINVNNAKAAAVEGKNLYDTAVITHKEYLEGLYVQERQTYESERFVAEETLSRAEEYLEYSKVLAAKGYVNELQLEADRFAVDKAQKDLDVAQTKIDVLDAFTKEKQDKQLYANILIAKAKWDAVENSYQLELSKLRDIEEQIAACQILSPAAGVVKYAHERNRRGDGSETVIEEGAIIRERQTIIRLPDASKMQVEVEVNESLVQYVREGMQATVTLVGATDRPLRGRVDSVNQYAEPDNWRRAGVKDYKAYVTIDEQSPIVKTGMTASVSISSIYVPAALQAPVQSVYAHGDRTYCFVERAGDLVAEPVVIGATNDRFFIIESGLDEEDRIALNPRRLADRVELPELAPEQSQQAVENGRANRLLRERLARSEAENASNGATEGQ